MVVLLLVGLALIAASFPAYLLLDSARSHFRTMFLSGAPAALFLTALTGLIVYGLPAGLRAVLSLALVVLLGFLFMVSLVAASGIGLLGRFLNYDMAHNQVVTGVINSAMSFVLISLLFALIYKVMPNKVLYWRDVILGAMGTALLFLAGQALISLYVSRFLVANIYGAAGGVIVLLVWGYYSAQIFLLGAEYTKIFAYRYGSQSDPGPPQVSA